MNPAEFYALGYLKPTGEWLEAENLYYQHHSSIVATGPAAFQNAIFAGDTIASNEKITNIWEWTPSPFLCRLCGIDLVSVSVSPYVLARHGEFDVIAVALGSVRLELALDDEFTNGFYIEWSIDKHAHYDLVADTLEAAGGGTGSSYGGYRSSIHKRDRSIWLKTRDQQPLADISSHVHDSLPSWIAMQFVDNPLLSSVSNFRTRHNFVGRQRRGYIAIPFPNNFGPTWRQIVERDPDWPDSVYDGTQELDFLKSTLTLGRLSGEVLESRTDYGPQCLLRDNYLTDAILLGASQGPGFLSLGVHNNQVLAVAQDSFFSAGIQGDEWLEDIRRARLRIRTAADNTFVSIPFGSQGSPSNEGSPEVFTASSRSPAVRSTIKVFNVTESDAKASPRTAAAIQAATGETGPSGPALLAWSPYQDTTEVRYCGSGDNEPASWRAARIASVHPFKHPPGQGRAFTDGSFAVGKGLSVSVETEFGSTQPGFGVGPSGVNSDGVEWAKLPTCFCELRSASVSSRGQKISGLAVTGGWTDSMPIWTPPPRTTAPLFNDDPQAYRAWRFSPTGGGVQRITDPGVTGPGPSGPLITYDETYSYAFCQFPSLPWMRYRVSGPEQITLTQNAGQDVYLGNITPTETLKPPSTLEILASTFTGQEKLTQALGIGNNAPKGYGNEAGQPGAGSFQETHTLTSQEWRSTFNTYAWPGIWVAPTEVAGSFGSTYFTNDPKGVTILEPTLPGWQYLAPHRDFVAVDECTYTPLQLDCVAVLTRAPTGAATADFPAEQYTQTAADQDISIPFEEAIYPQQRDSVRPQGGHVRLNWRKTWKIDMTIRSGPAGVTGTSGYTYEGNVNDLLSPTGPYITAFGSPIGDFFGSSGASGPDGGLEVFSLQEEVSVFWPSEQTTTQDVQFLCEDTWQTNLDLTEQQWQSLESGQSVELRLSQFSDEFVSTSNVSLEDYYANVGQYLTNSSARHWKVPAQLVITLQFT